MWKGDLIRGRDSKRTQRDSNPRHLFGALVFKTSAINHSAMCPRKSYRTP